MKKHTPPRRPAWVPQDATQFYNRHQGETAYVVGYGGSMHSDHPHYDGFDWDKLQGKLVIGLNNTIRHIHPTYWFFCDGTIWTQNQDRKLPPHLPIIIHKRMRHLNFPWPKQAYGVEYTAGKGWDPASKAVYMDATVATAGTCFAWHLGARKIVLVGVDCYVMKGHPYYADGTQLPEKNFRFSRSMGNGMFLEKRHDRWLEAFKVIDNGFRDYGAYGEPHCLRVYTTSKESPLFFRKISMKEAL